MKQNNLVYFSKEYQFLKWFEDQIPQDKCGVLDVSGEAEPLGYKNLLFATMILTTGMMASLAFLLMEHARDLVGRYKVDIQRALCPKEKY